jgi:protein-tyrosine phosphatase
LAIRGVGSQALPRGVENVWLNVLADSPQAGPAQLENLIQDPKAANAALGGGKVGKDRTGWATAALLTLLGVPRDAVMGECLQSNDNILPAYRKLIDAFVAGGGEEAIPLAALGVKKEYLETAFDEMETKYATIEKYFSEGLGIDAAGQKALREAFLAQE